MEALVDFGRSVAPFAIECAVAISLAALAGLAAVRLLGPRRPARAFAFLAAALFLGGLSLADWIRPPAILPEVQETVFRHPGAAPVASEALVATRIPGLTAKYGSLFQVRFTGRADRRAAGTVPPGTRNWLGLAGLLWLLGFGFLTLRHLLDLRALHTLLAGARNCEDRRLLHAAAFARDATGAGSAELRLSARCRIPFLAGVRRPVIVLPEEALRWPEDRLNSTLLHEHLHARRLDVPVAGILRFLVSLAWCSPLAWLAWVEALRLREQACDAAVLEAGVPAADYASDLLAAARACPGALRASAAMAGRSDLEGRIRAILRGPGLHQRGEALRSASAGLMLGACLGLVPLKAGLHDELARLASPAPEGAEAWSAAFERGGRGSFSLAREGGYTRIQLVLDDRTLVARVPTVALPGTLPLSARARLLIPFGEMVDAASGRPFLHPGWTLWDDRGRAVRAAGTGRVSEIRFEERRGLVVELDHGAGLRTRYGLGPLGTTALRRGEFVPAGAEIGTPGEVSPLDLPAVDFRILLAIEGRQAVLDPAPFLLAAPENRAIPFGTSLLNAAVRLGDQAQVRRLIARGLDLNRVSTDGTLPLEWVVLTRDHAIARDLVAAGADPLAPTWNTHQAHIALHGPTVAELARGTGDAELAELLSGRPATRVQDW